jgi:hypothetical protein
MSNRTLRKRSYQETISPAITENTPTTTRSSIINEYNNYMNQYRDVSENPDLILTIARMNPPTSGHVSIIEKMLLAASKFNLNEIYLVLSNTLEYELNPLECEKHKKEILTNYIIPKLRRNLGTVENINIHILCGNPYKTAMDLLYQKNPRRPMLIIGEDKLKINKVTGEVTSSYNSLGVDVVYLTRPEGAMSATYMRKLARSSDQMDNQKFLSIENQLGLDPEYSKEIFEKIREPGIMKNTSTVKQKTPTVKQKTVFAGYKWKRKNKKTRKQQNKRTRKNKKSKK